MEVDLMTSALSALAALSEPERLGFLFFGVLCGLFLGVVPGLGGLVGLTLLLPFTFTMDAYTAMAFLMGLAAVTAMSDSIPAVMFGVPGTVAAQATIMDGFPMARNGEAGRALGAAFTASVIGGIIGAVLLLFTIPILRPAVLAIARPEMLAIIIFGLSLAASLAGSSQIRGLLVACVGLILAAVGQSRAGELRWTFDSLYLYDGLHIIPITLGLFALPEIADMIIQRSTIARRGTKMQITMRAQFQGMRDVVQNWVLVLRCSVLGAGLGAIPGIGATVIDWIAYGHAVRTVKGAKETFGKGDVRGVIAPEAATNSKESGSLVPTVAFGIPGSASMALILAALLTLGVVPGPGMLTHQLDVTYTLVWSVALANIFGAAICILFANQIAKAALVRISVLGPIVLVIVFFGAYQGKQAWGDMYTFLAFGAIGFTMKRLGWPRPPLILGVVLGALLEDNAFITANVYGWSWLGRPIALIILLITLFGIARPMFGPLFRWLRERKATNSKISFNGTNIAKGQLFLAFVMAGFFSYTLISSMAWGFRSSLVPYSVSVAGLILTALLFVTILFRLDVTRKEDGTPVVTAKGMHMDHTTDFSGIELSTIIKRTAVLAAWLVGATLLALLIGLIPAGAVFLLGMLVFKEREKWLPSLVITVVLIGMFYFLFHVVIRISWEPAWIGDIVPGLRSNPWLNIV